ncbi:MAG: hypothetical protein QXT64_03370 [Desulfurococcaceae archaeon]
MERELYPFELEIATRFSVGGTLTASPKSEWIRGYLLHFGEGYPYGMWKEYQVFARYLGIRPGTYADFVKYVYYLRRLGLVVPVREGPSNRRGLPRVYYRVKPGTEMSPLWRRPLQALFPSADWSRPEVKSLYRGKYR